MATSHGTSSAALELSATHPGRESCQFLPGCKVPVYLSIAGWKTGFLVRETIDFSDTLLRDSSPVRSSSEDFHFRTAMVFSERRENFCPGLRSKPRGPRNRPRPVADRAVRLRDQGSELLSYVVDSKNIARLRHIKRRTADRRMRVVCKIGGLQTD